MKHKTGPLPRQSMGRITVRRRVSTAFAGTSDTAIPSSHTMAIQVQMPEQSAEGMALSHHCLCMEPVVTTFPPLGALFGSYGQAHRTSSLQDHTQTSRRAHDTACHMLGSLRLLACKTKSHRNLFSPQKMVGESKSHAHSHKQFPSTARSSLGKNAQIIPGLPTTTLNLF